MQLDLNNRSKKCLNYLTPNEVHFVIKINTENMLVLLTYSFINNISVFWCLEVKVTGFYGT